MLADRYDIMKILGEGATGTVYLGFDRHEKVEVAIKSQVHGRGREYQIHSRLSHEHIVKLKNFIRGERRDYLIFERCNFSLLVFINSHDIDVRASLKIMRMILLGIKYLHDQGIIHRDIKLGNILIKDDTVKICDLGLSCFAIEKDFSYCGTKDYLAPEIVKSMNGGKGGYDNKVDMYAAGVVFKILMSKRKDISVDELDFVDKNIKEFIKGLLNENPSERSSANAALKSGIFGELIREMPDFRMVKPFSRVTRYGEVSRNRDYAQIRWGPDGNNNNFEIKIKYQSLKCDCSGAFSTIVYRNGEVVLREYLTETELKYFNYLAGYLRILCSKTPKVKISNNELVFTCFLDGSFIYEGKDVKIRKSPNDKFYMVNNQKRASLDSVCAGEVERLQSACAEKCKNCICFENRLVETNPTMTLTIGDQRIAKDIAFLHGVGWCVKDNLCFQFLLNNGMRLIINAQRRVLLYVGRTYKIDRNMPKECLEELKGVKGLLEEFVK